MTASSTGKDNTPALARAVGCRVSADRRSVTILLPSSRAVEFIEAVRHSRRIAVVFSQPSTYRTIQLKGNDAAVIDVVSGDTELSKRQADAFVADVCPLGYAEELIRMLVPCDPADLTAIRFAPDAAFHQTPGPKAGSALNS